MGIQKLLNKAPGEAGNLEKFSDMVLALPRALWLDKKVTVIRHSHYGNIVDCKTENVNNLTKKLIKMPVIPGIASLANVVAAIAYVTLSILAAPFLGVGLILKKISISQDWKSNNYSIIVQKRLDIAKYKQEMQKTPRTTDKQFKKHNELIAKISTDEALIQTYLRFIWGNYKQPVPL